MTHLTRWTMLSLAIHLLLLATLIHGTPPPRQQATAAVAWVVDLTTDLRNDGGREPERSVPSRSALTAADRPQLRHEPPATSGPDHEPLPPEPAGAAKEAGSATIAGKTLPVDPAIVANAFRNTMNAQALLMQMRQFFRQAGSSVRCMVDGAFSASERMALEGERGVVVIVYGDGATIDSLSITADNEAFRTFLAERVLWTLAPPPRESSLPFRSVIYSITLAGSGVKVVVSPG